MNCAAFDRWLDEGMPPGSAEEARRHALACAACAVSLRAAEAVEAALLGEPIAAPAGFADRVMERVAAEAPARPFLPVDLDGPPLPLWLRCLMQPSMVLAGILAACLIDWGPELFRLGRVLYTAIDAGLSDPALGGFLRRNEWMAWFVAICLLALLPPAGRALYRAGTRMADPGSR